MRPKRFVKFYTESNYIKIGNTSWTYSTIIQSNLLIIYHIAQKTSQQNVIHCYT